MKSIIAMLLLAATGLSLFACTSGGGDSETTDGSSSASDSSDTETTAQETTSADETTASTENEEDEDYYGYLFVYFTGNDASQERVFYALSKDGKKFRALNGGEYILRSKSGTRCIRDPFIFKGEDGYYYMIATDMRSSLGWNSNNSLITWKSEDLIEWTDETIIEIDGICAKTKNTDRAWAPQVIYDPERGEYMIYFALHSTYTGSATVMYYAYTADMKTLTTDPELLFAPSSGNSAIDADIIYNETDGLYYMFYKDETSGGIKLTSSATLTGGYSDTDAVLVSQSGLAVEGSCTFKNIDGSGWTLIADAYTSGYFTMSVADTLESMSFTSLSSSDFSFNFTPRHGYVIPITEEQYKALLEAYPYSGS